MTDETKNGGGPAFPVHPEIRDNEPHAGMTLRDYFAGQAIIGLLSGQFRNAGEWNLREVPEEAFAIADAMIRERSK